MRIGVLRSSIWVNLDKVLAGLDAMRIVLCLAVEPEMRRLVDEGATLIVLNMHVDRNLRG
jgi:hypothetical protein